MILGTFRPRNTHPIWKPFWFFCLHGGGKFFVVFLGAPFSYILQFWGSFEVRGGMLFGVPGNLGNKVKALRGVRFSHFGGSFCRYEFEARSGGLFFRDFYDF